MVKKKSEAHLMFRKGSKARKFVKLAPPDAKGFSRKVLIEELEENGLGFGNGADWCRANTSLAKKFKVKKYKKNGKKSKIIAIKLNGHNKNTAKKSHAPDRIRKCFKTKRCVVLNTSEPEVDHKYGREDDPNYQNDDFQPLSTAANDAKREHCIRCQNTNKRFDARVLGFSRAQLEGSSTYETCIGCYWHDPFRFHKEISGGAGSI